MSAMPCHAMPGLRRSVLACMLASSCALTLAQDSERADWLRNPAMGNYKAYAEFKMAHYCHFQKTIAQTSKAECTKAA